MKFIADLHIHSKYSRATAKNLDLEKRVEDLLSRLTLEEKFKLSSGRLMWHTKPIKRLSVKPFTMYDGPHGVRADTMGEIKSTYFPSAICRAATWNPKLSYDFGKAVAEEVRDVGAHMLLAPGINIQRTPMNGRTFEYQTEDPYLNKVLAVATVKGIQSQKIAACVKHFVCNNQETNRFTVSSEVSETCWSATLTMSAPMPFCSSSVITTTCRQPPLP